MKNIVKILEIIATIFLTVVILVNFTLIIKGDLNKDEVPDILGYKPFIIVSGSMEPTIKTNDIVITKEIKQEDIQKGDILSYKSKDNLIITHRVIDIIENETEEEYIFKGDNNNVEDIKSVKYSEIEGEYLFSIPLIGSIALYVQTPTGLAASILIIFLIYSIIEIVRKLLEKEEVSEEKEKDLK